MSVYVDGKRVRWVKKAGGLVCAIPFGHCSVGENSQGLWSFYVPCGRAGVSKTESEAKAAAEQELKRRLESVEVTGDRREVG